MHGNLKAPLQVQDRNSRAGKSIRNSFVQYFGGEELDAAALLIPIHRFLPPDDPRVLGTIDAVWTPVPW